MSAVLASHGSMNGFMGGGGSWFWPAAVALHVAFWVLVVWLIVRFARPGSGPANPKARNGSWPSISPTARSAKRTTASASR